MSLAEVKPKSHALSCKSCQDCCDDTTSRAAKHAREAFDFVRNAILALSKDGRVAALAVPQFGARVTVRFNISTWFGAAAGFPLAPDPTMVDTVNKAFDIYKSEQDRIDTQGVRDQGTIQISLAASPSQVFESVIDGAKNGLSKNLRKVKDDCFTCCLAKRWKQTNPMSAVVISKGRHRYTTRRNIQIVKKP